MTLIDLFSSDFIQEDSTRKRKMCNRRNTGILKLLVASLLIFSVLVICTEARVPISSSNHENIPGATGTGAEAELESIKIRNRREPVRRHSRIGRPGKHRKDDEDRPAGKQDEMYPELRRHKGHPQRPRNKHADEIYPTDK